MPAGVRLWFSIVLVVLFSVQPAIAFTYPLSPEAIREAYFVATGDAARRANVFAKYIRMFPTPPSGPYVASIMFETPYIAVTDRIAQNAMNYHAPDAEQRFLGKPVNCHAIVQVYFPSQLYESEFDNFTVELKQNGREIRAESKHGTILYSELEPPAPMPIGIQMDVEYRTDRINPDEGAKVEVAIDNGPTVHATFDLSQLR